MKAHHKAFVTKATAARKSIKDETLIAADLQSDLSASKTRLKHLRGELSEIEAEAAEAGLSVADLHSEVDKKMG